MDGEQRLLVPEEPIILEEFIEYTPNYYRRTERCQHGTWKHQDLDRLCPKLPAHCLGAALLLGVSLLEGHFTHETAGQ